MHQLPMAAPTITRPIKSISLFTDAPITMEPATKRKLLARITGFLPNFSLKNPPISEKMAAAPTVTLTTSSLKLSITQIIYLSALLNCIQKNIGVLRHQRAPIFHFLPATTLINSTGLSVLERSQIPLQYHSRTENHQSLPRTSKA